MPELSKGYQPLEVESKWYRLWVDAGCFRADESSPREAYSIVIPPPNVTGVLHLGHVLNNSIQDILARRARMTGREVLWLPGTDHAGIATQAVVERELLKSEKKTRRDIGREEFERRVWKWKETHGGIIIKQLKRLGCSCDWDRERFTMDEAYSRRVAEVFVDLFNKGLIYRGRRMVNWCPQTLTALSDEEVEMIPQRSKLYYMRYAVAGEPGRFLQIATTRPETLMGDTAVAVNPGDERYRDLIGRRALRPFPPAEIPIIADERIDPKFGTGVLKVTPAHDRADFEIGQAHGLEIREVLHPDGTVNCPSVPGLDGLDRFEAREAAAAKLEAMGLLDRVEDYENSIGYSQRGHVPVEPRISMQWFLRYPSVAQATGAVARDEIHFRPERWKKTYLHWMENIQDWCISRQLWWGHRIPVWYRSEREEELRSAESLESATCGSDLHVSPDAPQDPGNWVQDPDVLDTWFSSWLWPFATMDKPTRKKFYPTTDLVTGPDIIFFWVARMIMAGFEYEGRLPFRNVFFTSIIRDMKGRKMSKSLGNSPDPLDLMDKYGADGLRFGLMRIAPVGQDTRYDESQIEEGRNFANKLWNAARYRQMQGGNSPESGVRSPEPPANGGRSEALDSRLPTLDLSLYALDILAKLDLLETDVADAFARYRFDEICQRLYEFFWSEYCDRYLESIKNDFREGAAPASRAATLAVMDRVLSRYLLLLHPFMPHITEELWETMGYRGDGDFIMRTGLPRDPALDGIDPARVAGARERAGAVYDAARALRNLKAEYNVGASRNVRFVLEPAVDWIGGEIDTLRLLAGAESILLRGDAPAFAASGTPAAATPLGTFHMPLEGLIDVAAEKERLGREVQKVEKDLAQVEGKLGNASFVERAAPEVVSEARTRRESLLARRDQIARMILLLH